MFEYYVLREYLSIKMLKIYYCVNRAECKTILQNIKLFHVNYFLFSLHLSTVSQLKI